MPKPKEGTYHIHFQNYIGQVKEDNLKKAFKNQQELVNKFFASIPEDKTNTPYAEGKWTLKELLQHVIDGERIFTYRALAIARKEQASLPSFEENDYAANSNANSRKWKSLCDELKAVRKSTRMMFNSFSKDAYKTIGVANNNPLSVLAAGFITVGHLTHHIKIVEERYL